MNELENFIRYKCIYFYQCVYQDIDCSDLTVDDLDELISLCEKVKRQIVKDILS